MGLLLMEQMQQMLQHEYFFGYGAWNAGANSNKTYTVKVITANGSNKYRFDDHGTNAVTLDLAEGSTYIFDQSDSSNRQRFSTTSGMERHGNQYTTGVTHTGTPAGRSQ